MKLITYLFWSAVGGIVFCLAGTIYTAVGHQQTRKAVEQSAPHIPLPAEAPTSAPGR